MAANGISYRIIDRPALIILVRVFYLPAVLGLPILDKAHELFATHAETSSPDLSIMMKNQTCRNASALLLSAS